MGAALHKHRPGLMPEQRAEAENVRLYDMKRTKKMSSHSSQDSPNLMERANKDISDLDTISVQKMVEDVNDVKEKPYIQDGQRREQSAPYPKPETPEEGRKSLRAARGGVRCLIDRFLAQELSGRERGAPLAVLTTPLVLPLTGVEVLPP